MTVLKKWKMAKVGHIDIFCCADGIVLILVCAVRNVSCAVTYCAISHAPTWSLDTGVRCIFDWNSRLSRKWYEIGTDPINIKYPVARVSQHQLSFLLLPVWLLVHSDVFVLSHCEFWQLLPVQYIKLRKKLCSCTAHLRSWPKVLR